MSNTFSSDERERLEWAIRQRDGIMALSGFKPTPLSRAIDEAVLAGRTTFAQARAEIIEWAKEHKSLDGFLATRSWAQHD